MHLAGHFYKKRRQILLNVTYCVMIQRQFIIHLNTNVYQKHGIQRSSNLLSNGHLQSSGRSVKMNFRFHLLPNIKPTGAFTCMFMA